MIEVKDLHKSFGKLDVLKGVSFSIDEGGVFAILGPNGSGKTTLLKTLLGMVMPNSGEVRINERSTLGKYQYRKELSYLSQIARFPENLSIKEVVQMIADLRVTEGRSSELIRLFGLDGMLDKKLGELSGGTRQKVNLVLTFMFDSPILILDEPTAGLDPEALIKLKELIQEEKDKGRIILITTHIIGLVEEIAGTIIFLLDGKVFFNGSAGELLEQTGIQNLEAAIAKIYSGDKDS